MIAKNIEALDIYWHETFDKKIMIFQVQSREF